MPSTLPLRSPISLCAPIDHPLERPHELRREALGVATSLIGAEAAAYHMLVRGADRIVRFHGVGGVGATPAAERIWLDSEGLAMLLADIDLDHIAPFNELGRPPEDFYGTGLWRTLFEEPGYQRVAFMNVTAGPLLRGTLLLLRTTSEPWPLSQQTLEDAAGPLAAAFRAAWDLEASLAAPNGVAALRPDGTIATTEALGAWLTEHDAHRWLRARAVPGRAQVVGALGASEAAWAPGAFVHVQAIPGGGTLMTFSRVESLKLPAVVYGLTALQRRVASFAAAGATAVEIARELDRSPETVREHLSRIYARLGVASRSELATVCRRMLH